MKLKTFLPLFSLLMLFAFISCNEEDENNAHTWTLASKC